MNALGIISSVILISTAAASPTTDRPDLWAWLSGHTEEAVAQIHANSDIITDISMGGYAVDASGNFAGAGPNATLVAELQALGIRVWPLIGCGSSPTLRTLFANPGPFVAAAVKEAARLGVAGFNLDFEPYDGHGVADDGRGYGAFLKTFADALHAATPPRKLSLDFFSNLPLWDLAAMNASSVDYMISMDTYVPGNATFEAYYNLAAAHIAPDRLGVGMCTGVQNSHPFTPFGPDPCGTEAWTPARVLERMKYLLTVPFAQLNLWVLPVPDAWWNGLQFFFHKLAQKAT